MPKVLFKNEDELFDVQAITEHGVMVKNAWKETLPQFSEYEVILVPWHAVAGVFYKG